MFSFVKQNRLRIKSTGFTLLELLVVLVVMGILLGMVSINAIPNSKKALLDDAQRIALLLQLAREEAIVQNRPVAFELDSAQFRFYVRSDSSWQPLIDNDLFRERSFNKSPLVITLQPAPVKADPPFRIIFGREPVDKPFVLILTFESASVSIQADGLGHFAVESL